MELRPDRLERQLASEPLRPVYLVAGAEPLLVQEAADAIARCSLPRVISTGTNSRAATRG